MSRGKKRSRSSRHEAERVRRVKLGLVGVAALVAAGLAVVAMLPSKSASSYVPPTSAPTFETVDSRPVAVFLGDSYTQGTGASKPAAQWTSLVSANEGWREENLGRGGTGFLATSTFQGCGLEFCPNYGAMIPDAVFTQPSVLVISGGQNDFNTFVTSRQSVVEAINSTYAAARAAFPDLRIICVGPSTPNDVDPDFIAFDQTVHNAATSVGADYVSLIAPPVIEKSMVLFDGGHVDDAGHAAIAERVIAGIGAG